jgi:hypothetical protein
MWVCPGVGVDESWRRCGRVPCRCGRSPRTDVGAVPAQTWPAVGKAAANPGADVDKQRLSGAQALARACVCASACACVRSMLSLDIEPIQNSLCCCLCECAHVHGGSCVSRSAYARACAHGRWTWRRTEEDCVGTRLCSLGYPTTVRHASAGSRLMLAGLVDYSKCLLHV